ncbi:hypothetical protein MRX96_058006 [Rhipicephalus microplus]
MGVALQRHCCSSSIESGLRRQRLSSAAPNSARAAPLPSGALLLLLFSFRHLGRGKRVRMCVADDDESFDVSNDAAAERPRACPLIPPVLRAGSHAPDDAVTDPPVSLRFVGPDGGARSAKWVQLLLNVAPYSFGGSVSRNL